MYSTVAKSSDGGSSLYSALAVLALLAGIVGIAVGMIRSPGGPSTPPPSDTAASRVPITAGEGEPATLPTENSAPAAPAPVPEAVPAFALERPAAPQPSAPEPPSLEEVVGRAVDAVVLIETAEGRGSAFFVAADTLLTNVHVVGQHSTVTVRRARGGVTSARVAATAPAFDLAVLKVAAPDPDQAVLKLGSALNARVGQDVIAIGSALGTLQSTVTRGIVSALRQSGSAMLVQTDAAVNPGNSGGPLLDRRGTVIGITTMGYVERQGLNFAVAADHARPLLDGAPAAALLPRTMMPSAASDGLSPAIASDSERARAAGTAAYDAVIQRLSAEATALDDHWLRFHTACRQGASDGGSHPWFAALGTRETQGSTAPGCAEWLSDIRQRAAAIERAVIDADEAARRADVYPGVRRETRRKYRLDYEGWDR